MLRCVVALLRELCLALLEGVEHISEIRRVDTIGERRVCFRIIAGSQVGFVSQNIVAHYGSMEGAAPSLLVTALVLLDQIEGLLSLRLVLLAFSPRGHPEREAVHVLPELTRQIVVAPGRDRGLGGRECECVASAYLELRLRHESSQNRGYAGRAFATKAS